MSRVLGGGIGRVIALEFAKAGADVAICDRIADDGKLEDVREEIKGTYENNAFGTPGAT
ncbi:hypothetical protein ACFLTR_01465 [Chloroflexota bacterium]